MSDNKSWLERMDRPVVEIAAVENPVALAAQPAAGRHQAFEIQVLDPPLVICRFSCGAASAVATKLAIAKYGTVEIYYNDPGSEHSDNLRFINDCEKWFGQKVNILKSDQAH